MDSDGRKIISHSPATDTIGDSVFYVEADGGSYISDYLNTYSYGRSSPDLFGDSSKDGWRIASSGSAGSLGDHYVYDSYG